MMLLMTGYFLRVVFAIFLILIQAVKLFCNLLLVNVLGKLIAIGRALRLNLLHYYLVVILSRCLMTLWTVILHLFWIPSVRVIALTTLYDFSLY